MSDRYGSFRDDEPVIGLASPAPRVPVIGASRYDAPDQYAHQYDGEGPGGADEYGPQGYDEYGLDDGEDAPYAAPTSNLAEDDEDPYEADPYDAEDDAAYEYSYDQYYGESPARQPLFLVFVVLAMLVGAGAIYLLYNAVSGDDDDTVAPATAGGKVEVAAQIVQPREGDHLKTGQLFEVVVQAVASEPIAKFDLYFGSNLVDTQAAPPPEDGDLYRATLAGKFSKRGDYQLLVRVTSVSGATLDTLKVNVSAFDEPGELPVTVKGKVLAKTIARAGPGEGFDAVREIFAEAEVSIVGKTANSQWLLIDLGGGAQAWVKREAVQEADSLALVPNREPTPTPFPTQVPRATPTPDGNTVTPTPGSREGVDLAPLNAVLLDGGTVLRVTVGNLGTETFSGTLVVSATGVNAEQPTRAFSVTIAPNQATTVDFTLDPPVTAQKSANIRVDPENVVKEPREDNNAATFVVSAGGSGGTPTPTPTEPSGTPTATPTPTQDTPTPAPTPTPTPEP